MSETEYEEMTLKAIRKRAESQLGSEVTMTKAEYGFLLERAQQRKEKI